MASATIPRTFSFDRASSSAYAYPAVQVLMDVFFVFVNAALIFFFRFGAGAAFGHLSIPQPLIKQYVGFLLLYGAFILLFLEAYKLYLPLVTRTVIEECLAIAKAVIMATVLLTVFIYLSAIKDISRLVVVGSAALNILVLSSWRFYRHKAIERGVQNGHGLRNLLIIGAGTVGQELARYLSQKKDLGYVVKGFIDQDHLSHPQVLGDIEDLGRIRRAEFIDEVIITIPSERELVKKVCLEARRHRFDVKVVPDLFDGLGWRAALDYVGSFPLMSLYREPIPAVYLLLKRAFDLVVSCVCLLLFSPALAICALVVKLSSPGPVIYRSLRVGRKGRQFVCCKFRTMVADADAMKAELRRANERRGPFFKMANDPRITKVGWFLRRYSLDELPQLWNVLLGDMSLVGPRPHPVDDYNAYTLEHLRRLDVTPGITGLWQITARRDPCFEKNMALDLQYIENWSFLLDLKILLCTLPEMFHGGGQ